MGSKYQSLRGTIPEEPTERDQAFMDVTSSYEGKTVDELTAAYNDLEVAAGVITRIAKQFKIEADVLETLIRKGIEAASAENMSINGYTWTPKYEPYPRVSDKSGLIDYFIEQDMKDMLGVMDGKIKSFVKEEIAENELTIEIVAGIDQDGNPTEKKEVHSALPGVLVYLKPDLGRVKSTRGAK